MLCGNGGSAADAQHLACELLIRLRSMVNRQSLPALSLATDTSTLTACANDYEFDYVYERLVTGLGKPGDVLLGITTSGQSASVVRALQAAKQAKILTFGFLGNQGGEALKYCDLSIIVPSTKTDRIQEVHITLGHILMECVENLMLESGALQAV
jgi:D-sedoheptulose 7-phosphate isomerase